MRSLTHHEAAEFLEHVLETNSDRIQGNVLTRVQKIRGRLEIEVKKLLHAVTRIAEAALAQARLAREIAAVGVQEAFFRLNRIEREICGVRPSV